MKDEHLGHSSRYVVTLFVAYSVASLFHYAHNAALLNEYPNMPRCLSRATVYAAWVGVTSIGLLGYFLFRSRYRRTGLSVLTAYGLIGLDGLGHYAVAPVSAHTLTMNASILSEAGTALLLLAAIAMCSGHHRGPITVEADD